MALINCPECGQEVSDRANACPKCAFPLQTERTDGMVRIKFPSYQMLGLSSLITVAVRICNDSGHELWRGELNQIASFSIDAPQHITIYFSRVASPVSGNIFANKKYQLSVKPGIHWKAQFLINEVDVIDSD
jgi:DNA-directed RNA polymerase subunit RPC12/RpoP